MRKEKKRIMNTHQKTFLKGFSTFVTMIAAVVVGTEILNYLFTEVYEVYWIMIMIFLIGGLWFYFELGKE